MQPRGGVSPAVAAMPCFVYSNFKRTGTPRPAASIAEGVLLLLLPRTPCPEPIIHTGYTTINRKRRCSTGAQTYR